MRRVSIAIGLVSMVSILVGSAEAQWLQGNSGTTERLTDVAMLDSCNGDCCRA